MEINSILQYWEDLTRPIAEFDSWRSKRIQLTKREKLITYISSANVHEESCKFTTTFYYDDGFFTTSTWLTQTQ